MSLLFCSICYVLCFIFQIAFLILEKKQKMVTTLYFKGLASISFVVLGAISFLQTSNVVFAALILVGLVFDALADVVFNLRFAFQKLHTASFAGGTFLFFTGHIFYVAALFPQVQKWWLYLIIGFVVMWLVQLFFALTLENVSKTNRIYGVVYTTMVSIMMVMSAGNMVEQKFTTGSVLFALGAVFFFISDCMLIFNTFRTKKIYPVRIISFMTYYTGQLLIATSLFIL